MPRPGHSTDQSHGHIVKRSSVSRKIEGTRNTTADRSLHVVADTTVNGKQRTTAEDKFLAALRANNGAAADELTERAKAGHGAQTTHGAQVEQIERDLLDDVAESLRRRRGSPSRAPAGDLTAEGQAGRPRRWPSPRPARFAE
jgi:hypothetical protein